jgi:hypothetical protein
MRYPSIQLPSLSKILDMIDDNRVRGRKNIQEKESKKKYDKKAE